MRLGAPECKKYLANIVIPSICIRLLCWHLIFNFHQNVHRSSCSNRVRHPSSWHRPGRSMATTTGAGTAITTYNTTKAHKSRATNMLPGLRFQGQMYLDWTVIEHLAVPWTLTRRLHCYTGTEEWIVDYTLLCTLQAVHFLTRKRPLLRLCVFLS